MIFFLLIASYVSDSKPVVFPSGNLSVRIYVTSREAPRLVPQNVACSGINYLIETMWKRSGALAEFGVLLVHYIIIFSGCTFSTDLDKILN